MLCDCMEVQMLESSQRYNFLKLIKTFNLIRKNFKHLLVRLFDSFTEMACHILAHLLAYIVKLIKNQRYFAHKIKSAWFLAMRGKVSNG